MKMSKKKKIIFAQKLCQYQIFTLFVFIIKSFILFQQQNIVPMSINEQQKYSSSREFMKNSYHKPEFSFSTPQEDPTTVLKKISVESRKLELTRNRKQLFTEFKQNSFLSTLNKNVSKEFVDQMRTEQRVEVQKLLLQISRLHDLLESQQKLHKNTIQRMKQQSEQIALLRISNLKQSQFTQIQILEHQLKKTKQALDQKALVLQQLEKSSSRKIEVLTNQNEALKNNLKQFIEKKNIEIIELRAKFSKQSQEGSKKYEQTVNQLKQLAQKELKKVLKRLQERQKQIQSLSVRNEQSSTEKQKSLKLYEEEKRQLEQRIQQQIEHQRLHHQELFQKVKRFYQTEAERSEQQAQYQRELFKIEIQNLMKIIKIKDNEAQRNLIFRETQRIDYKLQIKNSLQEKQFFKELIQKIKKEHMQEIEFLKVKMAILHKSDIESLVRLYEVQIQTLVKEVEYSKAEVDRIYDERKKQKQVNYEMKKKYDYTVSFLRQEISELRLGAGSYEKQMKDKLENEKSMMMLTSRNFIKENQVKANNIRFYEEELRKLRQLLQIQAQEVQESERNVEEKIKLAEQELNRLSNKIIEVKSEAEESEKKLKEKINEQEQEIRKLNEILKRPKGQDKFNDNTEELRKLDYQISKRQDQIRTLKNKNEDLQSNVKMLRAQNERLILENQINTEDAKKQYKKISDKNLADMKAFYDRRLQELENDKKELNRIISSQSQQISQLIKKYKDLEESIKQLLRQNKKRSDLQEKIINLGMDTNLVKNMGELFHK